MSSKGHHEMLDVQDSSGEAENDDPMRFGFAHYIKTSLHFLFWNKMSLLLVFVPIALICESTHASNGAIFATCMLGIIPLAAALGDVTEQLALHTNETIGGLLNASFGNATEVIVCVFAIRAGMLRIVQLSLLGSVLSNMLLVMGCAFLAGGIKYKQQQINTTASNTNTALLFVTASALSFVTIMTTTGAYSHAFESELALSRFMAICMLITYAAFLYFQLKTHSHLYDEDSSNDSPSSSPSQAAQSEIIPAPVATEEEGGALDDQHGGDIEMVDLDLPPARESSSSALATTSSAEPVEGGEVTAAEEDEDDDDEEEVKVLGVTGGLFWLFFITVFIAFLSEYLVDALEGASKSWGVPDIWVGTILLPIVGNAAEHASAVTVAYKNKITLSVGVALGSSIQISLMVLPLMVVVGWMCGQPLSLDFHVFEMASLYASVITVGFCINDGKANWLKGLVLVMVYILLAGAFMYHVDG